MAIFIPALWAAEMRWMNMGLTWEDKSDIDPLNLPPVWISIIVWSKSNARKLIPSVLMEWLWCCDCEISTSIRRRDSFCDWSFALTLHQVGYGLLTSKTQISMNFCPKHLKVDNNVSNLNVIHTTAGVLVVGEKEIERAKTQRLFQNPQLNTEKMFEQWQMTIRKKLIKKDICSSFS